MSKVIFPVEYMYPLKMLKHSDIAFRPLVDETGSLALSPGPFGGGGVWNVATCSLEHTLCLAPVQDQTLD